jgi:hypothetical protein
MKQRLAIHQSNKLLIIFINYLFWILLILYTNPGGIFDAFGIWYFVGHYNIKDLLFALLSVCYFTIPKSHDSFDEDFNSVRNFLLLFLVYYFIVFVYLVPYHNSTKNYSLLIAVTKSRWTIYSIFLFIYIYEFFKRNYDGFVKIFFFSSILILLLYLIQIIIKINILPVESINRGFININRMYNTNINDGLMPLFIPMGVTVIVFKLNIKYKIMIIIGFILMVTYYIVSITRRDIMGIFIYFILAIVINIFITSSFKANIYRMLKITLILIVITLGVYFIFPKYVEASRVGIVESINIVESGKESTGYKDERLGIRPFIVKQFLEHPLFGTGFDNRWRNKAGDKLGYEASDYPFLAAMSMFGILGILVFMPVYILLLTFLKNDLKYLRNKKRQNNSLFFLMIITFILFFIFHLLQYFNYFMAVSNPGYYYAWYFLLSLYLGARYNFYSVENQNNKLIPKLNLTQII